MREIKFRFWDSQENRYLLRGFVVRPDGYVYSPSNIHKVHQGNLQQFTGLKDKNDVEIYEGDIVLACRYKEDLDEDSKTYQVVWLSDPTYPAFELLPDDIGWEMNSISRVANEYEVFKVIGNIHETPELLEEV